MAPSSPDRPDDSSVWPVEHPRESASADAAGDAQNDDAGGQLPTLPDYAEPQKDDDTDSSAKDS